MQSKLSQEIDRRVTAAFGKLNFDVRHALTFSDGKPRPRLEAAAMMREKLGTGFKDKELAKKFCNDVDEGVKRRHGTNAFVNETAQECQRQLRRYIWMEADSHQDNAVEQLTTKRARLVVPKVGHHRI